MPDGWEPNDFGKAILAHGGADGMTDDHALILELASRAPGLSTLDLQSLFIELRMQYGKDALDAVVSGHVQFKLESTRDMEPARAQGKTEA